MTRSTASGPMFENAKSGPWQSVHNKDGGHYNNFGCRDEHGMTALRKFFESGKADEFNVCLFSTSGVHGTYRTIEEAEQEWLLGCDGESGEPCKPMVTFLIVQPRICTTRHGNCMPNTADDFAFLKSLRQSSWDALLTIGRDRSHSASSSGKVWYFIQTHRDVVFGDEGELRAKVKKAGLASFATGGSATEPVIEDQGPDVLNTAIAAPSELVDASNPNAAEVLAALFVDGVLVERIKALDSRGHAH